QPRFFQPMSSMRMTMKFGFGLARSSAGQTRAALRRATRTGRNRLCMGITPSGLLPSQEGGSLRRAGEIEVEALLPGEADEVPVGGELSLVAVLQLVEDDAPG